MPSANAKPLPPHLARKSKTSSQDPQNETPKADEPFCDPKGPNIWSEFHTVRLQRNPSQVHVDLSKSKQIWYYLGKTSTEAKAQYTEDPSNPRNNTEANFLESVRPLVPVVPPAQRQSYPASYPTGINVHALNGARAQARQRESKQPQQRQQVQQSQRRSDKPYKYKPRIHDIWPVDLQTPTAMRAFSPTTATGTPYVQSPNPTGQGPMAPVAPMSPLGPPPSVAPTAPMMAGGNQRSPNYMRDFEEYQRVSISHSCPSFHTKRLRVSSGDRIQALNLDGNRSKQIHPLLRGPPWPT